MCVSDCIADSVWSAIPEPPEWQHIGNQIDGDSPTRAGRTRARNCVTKSGLMREGDRVENLQNKKRSTMKNIMRWLTQPPIDGPASTVLIRLMAGGVCGTATRRPSWVYNLLAWHCLPKTKRLLSAKTSRVCNNTGLFKQCAQVFLALRGCR